ncbi:sensory box protein [Bordetella holmesii 30539]|nr:sensory box protein [Bordetella holmesii ATCC 51541]EWM48878.1 sensory box protein [Bordetella holmesii 41130]EWM49428.1 sensory box protein [Bordetella holmesii 35009]EXF90248.1 sensory box protein [Bordetella holmesii 30539]EXX94611.1 sensory box protein [Bordetella holmesii 1058]KAK82571.1 YheO-like protein [Bordetella holmesii CDC-H572-BH]
MSMSPRAVEQQALLDQLQHIACGLSQTFAPFCEVVLHDLRDPTHSILAIHNNLSGRQAGDPTTELGLARIADAGFPQVVANYANQFADGRQAKSTSIGIKDSSGTYVAALCLNVDLTLFRSMQSLLGQFSTLADGAAAQETLDPPGVQALRMRIDQFAARLASTPRSLKPEERRQLLRELKKEGYLDVRRAVEVVAQHLGVSRATVYGDAK